MCDIKEGEAWYEVAGELAQEGTRPITPDQECLQEILQITERKAEEVLKKQVKNNRSLTVSLSLCIIMQHELIDQQQELDIMEEQEYYSQVETTPQSTESCIQILHSDP